MRRLIPSFTAAWLATLASGPIVWAEGVYDHVPETALGVVAIHNLAETDVKMMRVAKIFEEIAPLPPQTPLALAKAGMGLGDGVDDSGDALLAILPAADGGSESVTPVLLVSVADYAALAESIGGDPSGEISRVTIAGEEVLAAKRDAYALLMNVENRAQMEMILAADASASPVPASLADWIAANDAIGVLLPDGVALLSDLGSQALGEARDDMDQFADQPQMAQLRAVLEMYDGVLKFLGEEVHALGIGVVVDDATNVRISKHILFKPDGRIAALPLVERSDRPVLDGYADAKFVFGGGGPMPREWLGDSSDFLRRLMALSQSMYNIGDLDEDDWRRLDEAWSQTIGDAYSIVMFSGNDGDPIYSNVIGLMQVDDSAAYMTAARESMDVWNDLMAGEGSTAPFSYEIDDVEIAGHKGFVTTTDMAAMMADQNMQMVAPMFSLMFGGDGKIRSYFVPATENLVVVGLATEENLTKVVESAAAGAQGLANSARVQTTAGLLDPQAQWTGYLSPAGCVAWFERLYNQVIAQIAGGTMTVPEYPASPPLGFSVHLDGDQLHGELVAPVETLKDLAAFIKTAQQ